jgi:hypothetical protein
VKLVKAMTPSLWKTPLTTTKMTKKRCRTASSCGRGLAARAYLMFLWCKTPRLAWRLAWLRRQGSRATPLGSG